MRARLVRLSAMILLGCAAACSAILGIETGNPEPATTGGADGSTEAGADAPAIPDPCEHARPVGPPTTDDAPDGGSLKPFILALENITITLPKQGRLGLDLDQTCTCDSRPGSANDGGGGCTRPKPLCDFDGGVDNSLAAIATQMAAFFEIEQGPIEMVEEGKRTLLLHIAEYNGLANDPSIAVGLIVSRGILTQGCPSSVLDDGFYRPGRCGDDEWAIEATSAIKGSGDLLASVIANGYVRDGQLVAAVDNKTVQFPFSTSQDLSIDGAMVLGKIIPLGEDLKPRDPNRPPTEREKRLFRLEEGMLVGRVSATNMLTALGTLIVSKKKDAGAQVCGEAFFPSLKETICNGVDLPINTTAPFGTTACEALSTGIGFNAMPALFGEVGTQTKFNGLCHPPAAGGDPRGIPGVTYRCP